MNESFDFLSGILISSDRGRFAGVAVSLLLAGRSGVRNASVSGMGFKGVLYEGLERFLVSEDVRFCGASRKISSSTELSSGNVIEVCSLVLSLLGMSSFLEEGDWFVEILSASKESPD